MIKINLENGTRIFEKIQKEYGRIEGSCIWRGKIAYVLLLDGWQDCIIRYPEEFDVIEDYARFNNTIRFCEKYKYKECPVVKIR